MGFQGIIDDVVCSGELAYQYLFGLYGSSNGDGKKGKFTWLTWDRTDELWTDGKRVMKLLMG